MVSPNKTTHDRKSEIPKFTSHAQNFLVVLFIFEKYRSVHRSQNAPGRRHSTRRVAISRRLLAQGKPLSVPTFDYVCRPGDKTAKNRNARTSPCPYKTKSPKLPTATEKTRPKRRTFVASASNSCVRVLRCVSKIANATDVAKYTKGHTISVCSNDIISRRH